MIQISSNIASLHFNSVWWYCRKYENAPRCNTNCNFPQISSANILKYSIRSCEQKNLHMATVKKKIHWQGSSHIQKGPASAQLLFDCPAQRNHRSHQHLSNPMIQLTMVWLTGLISCCVPTAVQKEWTAKGLSLTRPQHPCSGTCVAYLANFGTSQKHH